MDGKIPTKTQAKIEESFSWKVEFKSDFIINVWEEVNGKCFVRFWMFSRCQWSSEPQRESHQALFN